MEKVDDYMSFNGQDSCFNLKNGSKVFLISCRDIPSDPLYERFGSMQMTRGWIEEAGEIAEAAKANLWLSIGRWKNEKYGLKKKLLLTANPKKGWMKREFVDPFKVGILAVSRKFVSSLATDNTYNNALTLWGRHFLRPA
jgi:phage terminase large subunit